MSGEAAGPGPRAGDRTRTVLQRAPPGPAKPDHDNRDSWMKRFLNGEYDRWMLAKRLLNAEEDHVVVKILLDLFQSHGGFDGGTTGAEPGSMEDRQPVEGQTGPTEQSPQLTGPASPNDNGRASPPSETDEPDEPPTPSPPGAAEEEEEEGSGSHPATNGRSSVRNGRRTAIKKARTPRAAVKTAPEERPAPELPAVDPQLMPLFSCGLCGAGCFPSLADHFEHLWAAHTELRMLGSARRRRVPLKLRPHMFVLCALCGLNNRSTSTAGAADRHLTRAHLPARHRRALQTAAVGPLRFDCDGCDAQCGSRAELAIHALDAGHECPGWVCDQCGAEGEGAANERHHRLWHRAVTPFQCYLCAERFATEPECVSHVRAEHAASFNVHSCARCPYATSIVGQFIAHARSHVGLNTCVCHECGVTFQTAQSLRRHLMTHAWSEFRCQHCDKSFRHPLPLERHVRSQHVRPEDHKCGSCGKLFSSRYHMERHALIHSGRRPHQCHRCGRGFVQKGDLARHVRKCHAGEAGGAMSISAQPPPPPVVPAECPPPPPPIAPPIPPPPPPPIAPPIPPPPPPLAPPPMPPPPPPLAPPPMPLPCPPPPQSVLLQPPTLVMPLPAQGMV